MDNTDRNRTSPFAFTGNKFEFRAVGSGATCASPMTILNFILAHQLTEFKKDVDKLLETSEKKEMAIIQVLREYIKKSKGVLFEGDNYSAEWEKEAKKRKLPNVKSTPKALEALVSKKAMALFAEYKLMDHAEAHARYEVLLEIFIKKVQIESRVMGDLAMNHIIPTAIEYQNKLIKNIRGLKELGLTGDNMNTVLDTIKDISEHIGIIQKSVDEMTEARKAVNEIEETHTKAIAYDEKIKNTFFEKIRYSVDKLELIVDDDHWPLVKYREMLLLH
jgi:glutamine synthetase